MANASPEGAGRPARVLVVGCGNESRRDDGVGLYVIRRLADRLGLGTEEGEDASRLAGPAETASGSATVELRFEHQLDIVLADELQGVDLLVVVDAHTGAYPEALRRVEASPGYEGSMTSHHLTPETIAGVAQALHGRAPRTVVFSVRGYDFNFGDELSPATLAAANQAIEEIVGLLREA